MVKTEEVTPWKVKGDINYNRLIEKFGVKPISKESLNYIEKLSKKKGLSTHIFIKRNLFFAQMDFDKIVQAHKTGKKIFLYTGRSPAGIMHIGHLIQFLMTKYLQDIFDCNLYIQIPDDEKYLFKKGLNFKDIQSALKKDLIEISAFNYNPNKTFIFKNSEYISKMYPIYMNVARKITLSQARNTFGFQDSSNIGMINYPALQITPTFFEKGFCLIPCGIDQNPYFLLQRDFAETLGFHKNATILSKFLPPLTGIQGKMSASNTEKAIVLTDTPKEIKKKINKYAFSGGQPTIEEHRKYGGNPQIDVSFNWLYFLFEDDDKRIEQIKNDYLSGNLLSGELKQILIKKIVAFLDEHNKAKIYAEKKELLDKYMYSGKLAKEMWNKNFWNYFV